MRLPARRLVITSATGTTFPDSAVNGTLHLRPRQLRDHLVEKVCLSQRMLLA